MCAWACLLISRWAFCLARLAAECSLCFSVQAWHLPLPGRAALGQSRHRPVWRATSRSWCRRCRLYSFRWGVWLLARSYSLRGSGVCRVRGCLCCSSDGGFSRGADGFLLLLDGLLGASEVDWKRRLRGKVCWRVILLEYCAGGCLGHSPCRGCLGSPPLVRGGCLGHSPCRGLPGFTSACAGGCLGHSPCRGCLGSPPLVRGGCLGHSHAGGCLGSPPLARGLRRGAGSPEGPGLGCGRCHRGRFRLVLPLPDGAAGGAVGPTSTSPHVREAAGRQTYAVGLGPGEPIRQ